MVYSYFVFRLVSILWHAWTTAFGQKSPIPNKPSPVMGASSSEQGKRDVKQSPCTKGTYDSGSICPWPLFHPPPFSPVPFLIPLCLTTLQASLTRTETQLDLWKSLTMSDRPACFGGPSNGQVI